MKVRAEILERVVKDLEGAINKIRRGNLGTGTNYIGLALLDLADAISGDEEEAGTAKTALKNSAILLADAVVILSEHGYTIEEDGE